MVQLKYQVLYNINTKNQYIAKIQFPFISKACYTPIRKIGVNEFKENENIKQKTKTTIKKNKRNVCNLDKLMNGYLPRDAKVVIILILLNLHTFPTCISTKFT